MVSVPGHGAVLVGPTGIGKTSLATHAAQELLRKDPAIRIAQFKATDSTAASPLAVFVSVLGDYERFANERPEKVAQLIISACLASAAERGPQAGEGGKPSPSTLVIQIDDVPLLDNMSALVLETLMSRTDVRVILTCRSSAGVPAVVVRALREELITQIQVPALTDEEVGEITRELLPKKRLSPEAIARFARVSGGNLLYLTELVKSVDRSKVLENRHGYWVWRAPFPQDATVVDIIRADLDQLTAPTRLVLESIALSAPCPWTSWECSSI